MSASTPEAQLTIEERAGKKYRLPRSTYDEFAAVRPLRVEDGYRKGIVIDERVGPWQMAEGKLWFGKQFYDGEGNTGVGGFGYSAPGEGRFHLFAPPEIVAWSVSAVEVGKDVIWLGLVNLRI